MKSLTEVSLNSFETLIIFRMMIQPKVMARVGPM
ncbi:Uncharacterised protein [uncultured archaeon]|nr:Uncharacterised protein [uncultured archaeon]